MVKKILETIAAVLKALATIVDLLDQKGDLSAGTLKSHNRTQSVNHRYTNIQLPIPDPIPSELGCESSPCLFQ